MKTEVATINNTVVEFEEIDGVLYTNSHSIAKVFDKRHKNVMRDIEKLTSKQVLASTNFGSCTYVDPNNRILPMIRIDRDIFTVLVMGFTGDKALEWKVEYMRAFNRLLELYLNQNNKEDIEKFKADKERLISEFAEESSVNGIPKTKLIKAHWISDKNHPIAKQLKCFNEAFKQERGNTLLGDYFKIDVDKAGLALLEMGYTSYSRLKNAQKLLKEGI